MGIGGLSFFIGTIYPVSHNDDVAEAVNRDVVVDYHSSQETDQNIDTTRDAKISDSALASTSMKDSIPTPMESIKPEPVTPTPPPKYELTVGEYPEIDSFFQDYYVAWISCDYDLLKKQSTCISNTIPLHELQKETRFLDDIRDITCYVMRSYEDDSYIVFVYYDLKYINIKTALPRLDKFYLTTDSEGKFKIFNTEMDEMLKSYYDEVNLNSAVIDIIESTNDKAKAALENDESLRIYVESLYIN